MSSIFVLAPVKKTSFIFPSSWSFFTFSLRLSKRGPSPTITRLASDFIFFLASMIKSTFFLLIMLPTKRIIGFSGFRLKSCISSFLNLSLLSSVVLNFSISTEFQCNLTLSFIWGTLILVISSFRALLTARTVSASFNTFLMNGLINDCFSYISNMSDPWAVTYVLVFVAFPTFTLAHPAGNR